METHQSEEKSEENSHPQRKPEDDACEQEEASRQTGDCKDSNQHRDSGDEASRSSARPKRHPRDTRPYIGDYGEPLDGPGEVVALGFGMIVLSLAIGFFVGLFVWVVLWLSRYLTDLLWSGLGGIFGWSGDVGSLDLRAWWFPVAACTIGGVLIGVWTHAFHNAPRPLGQVLKQVKATGSYKLDGVGSSVVSFLLPIVFGGSVGPEAGLTGIVAAGCTWIGEMLRRAGIKAKEVVEVSTSAAITAILGTPFAGVVAAAEGVSEEDDEADRNLPNPNDYTFRRGTKIVLYIAAALGAFGGIALLTEIFGSSFSLPRFGSIEQGGVQLLWFFPCVAAAYVLTLVYHASSKGTAALSKRLGEREVLKPIVCGFVLGLVGIALPYVMFSGATQSSEIITTWTGMSAVALILTGAFKAAATPFCVGMGWHGGIFFPCIYAGVSCGYGIASLCGADPMLCVFTVTTAFLAGATRKPLLAIALLLLCFPVDGILCIGLAALAGAYLPLPKALRGASETRKRTLVRNNGHHEE